MKKRIWREVMIDLINAGRIDNDEIADEVIDIIDDVNTDEMVREVFQEELAKWEKLNDRPFASDEFDI